MKSLIYLLIVSYFLEINSTFSNETISDLSPLAYKDTWLNLLHYKKRGDGFVSSVTNNDFFLAASGKNNPQFELAATIEKFNHEPETQCRFPARAFYLKRHHLLNNRASCPEYEEWVNQYGPDEIEVNFATQYMSNAASAFGHVFVTIRSNYQPRNLHMTFNFVGEVTDGNAFSFAWNGLFGGFNSGYQLLPMSDRLKSYNQIENRGVWNYTLNLSDEEKEFAYKYLWENLKYGQKKYYFTVQNCASEIFHFISTIKETERKNVSFYIMPLEIIRYLDDKKLFKELSQDPSQLYVSNERFNLLSKNEKLKIKKLIKERDFSNLGSLNVMELDALIEYYQYLKIKRMNNSSPEVEQYWNDLLIARSKIKVISPQLENTLQPPHLIHPPQRIGYSILKSKNMTSLGFSYRPTFHSHNDPTKGLENNSDIEFLNISLLLQKNELSSYRAKIDKIDIFNINNFVPVNALELLPSWGVSASYVDQTFDEINFTSDRYFSTVGRLGLSLAKTSKWDWVFWGQAVYNAGHLKNSHHLNLGPQSIAMVYFNNSQLTLNNSFAYNPIKEDGQPNKPIFENQFTYSFFLKNHSKLEIEFTNKKSLQKIKSEINQIKLEHFIYF